MRIFTHPSKDENGSTLLVVSTITGVVAIITGSMLALSSNSVRTAHGRVDWNKAFYDAENAMVWAAQRIVDSVPPAGSSNYYSTASGTLPRTAITPAVNGDAAFRQAWVKVIQPTTSLSNVFTITASARVNDKVHTVQATVTAYPPSLVFDYEYFLNNWGWWWGSTITGEGDQRANWDFDFRDKPTVNGAIFAADYVEQDHVPYNQYTDTPPFNGKAGSDPLNLVHQGAPRVTMPNLLDFSVYSATAMADTTQNGLWQGGTQLVAGVQGNVSKPGLYLNGSPSSPITIKGTVVVPGDVVLQGRITGKGTLYVGGNLYIANDITYANGPNFNTPPETMSQVARDNWVAHNADKDLVAFAVRGSIFGGDVTDPDWKTWCYSYPGSGLQNVGDESHLGADGIAGTPDDNIPFLHPNGTWSTWYDADGDGTVQGNYNYNTDITMTSTRASKILKYPTDNKGNPVAFNQVATDNMGTLEGIFYTDHAAAMRLARGAAIFHGVVVSRNEQIIFQSTLHLYYDSRVHSRNHNNPNQYINLGLPFGKLLQVNSFADIAPDSTNL